MKKQAFEMKILVACFFTVLGNLSFNTIVKTFCGMYTDVRCKNQSLHGD